MNAVWSVLSFVVAIGVLVTVHEFGHFWVARRLGVRVLRFSIGFGRPLLVWHRRGDDTEYVLGAIPLGGYVKMLDESEGEVESGDLRHAFNRKPLAVRCAVVVAGPLFNFLFAVFAYWLMFVIGISGLRSTIGAVAPDSPAAQAGLRAGERIERVGGRDTRTWDAVSQALIGDALKGPRIDLSLVSEDGTRRPATLDLGATAVDDLARGRLFATVGMEPLRPRLAALIDEVIEDSPASRAGMRAGDRVVSADGTPIDDWAAWVAYVRARPEQPIAVVVERGGSMVDLSVTPQQVGDDAGGHGRIGAAVRPPGPDMFADFYVSQRYGAVDALGRAVARTAEATMLTLRMLWKMLLAEVSVQNLSGPISIAQYAGLSAQIGFARFVEFLGIVSVSLGVLNLLPIPLLDGGHLLFYAIEVIRGRPLSEDARHMGVRFGIALLVGLMGIAFYNDVVRLLG